MIVFRFLLFVLFLALLGVIIYGVTMLIITWLADRKKVLIAKAKKERELDNEEDEILISNIRNKTLADRYKDKEPENPVIKEAVKRRKNIKKKVRK